MATFGYEAIDTMGKTTKGSCDAESVDDVKSMLKAQGLILVSVREQNLLNKDINIEFNTKPKPRDLSVFCRQFVSMTKAGVTILDSLKMLEEQTENKMLRDAISGVRVNVEKGETLSNSVAMFPKVFPDLMVNMVAAGEASGSLDVAMDRMANHFEKSARIRSLVQKAMIYPIVVLCVAIGMIVVMLVMIIPKYTDMFDQLGTDLPGITVAVQKASDFLLSYWFILLPVVIALILLIAAWAKTDSGKHILHKIKLSVPAFRNLEVKQSSSMMARTLSTLMAAGVPLVEAVEIAGQVLNNVYFKEAMQTCKEEITIGQPFSRPLEDVGLFPPMVYHMVKIGEESGNTEEMLNKLADYYDEEVEAAVQALMAFMEPMIIIILAGIVLVLIGACMAPMFKMYGDLNSL